MSEFTDFTTRRKTRSFSRQQSQNSEKNESEEKARPQKENVNKTNFSTHKSKSHSGSFEEEQEDARPEPKQTNPKTPNSKRSNSEKFETREENHTEKKTKPEENEFHSLKEKGNELYKKCNDVYPSTLWAEKLHEAITFYIKAETATKIDQEKASAFKNIGMSYLKLFQVARTDKDKNSFASEALLNFHKARELGKNNKKEWLSHLKLETEGIIENVINLSQDNNRLIRISHYHKLKNLIHAPAEAVLAINFKMANTQFLEAVEKCEKKEFFKTLNLLADMNQPLLESLKIAKSLKKGSMVDDILDLETRSKLHLYRAESMKAKEEAKATIDKMIKEEDGMQMDMIWDAIDQLHFARGLLKEGDLEIEAEIYSEIGEIYYTFLKNEQEGTVSFKRSITLANALVPRIMSSVPWFKKASQRLREFQEKQAKLAEEQAQANYKRILEKYGKELQDQLEEIKKESEKKAIEFVKFIYKKHPSKKNPTAIVNEMLDMKKILQNALVYYHPDKNTQEEEKWIIITTEITKYLNYHYSQYTC